MERLMERAELIFGRQQVRPGIIGQIALRQQRLLLLFRIFLPDISGRFWHAIARANALIGSNLMPGLILKLILQRPSRREA